MKFSFKGLYQYILQKYKVEIPQKSCLSPNSSSLLPDTSRWSPRLAKDDAHRFDLELDSMIAWLPACVPHIFLALSLLLNLLLQCRLYYAGYADNYVLLILNLVIEATNFIKKVYKIFKKIFKYQNYRSKFSCIIYVFSPATENNSRPGHNFEEVKE